MIVSPKLTSVTNSSCPVRQTVEFKHWHLLLSQCWAISARMMCLDYVSYSRKESHCSAEMHTSVLSSLDFRTYPVITLWQRIAWAFSKKGKMSSSYKDTLQPVVRGRIWLKTRDIMGWLRPSILQQKDIHRNIKKQEEISRIKRFDLGKFVRIHYVSAVYAYWNIILSPQS